MGGSPEVTWYQSGSYLVEQVARTVWPLGGRHRYCLAGMVPWDLGGLWGIPHGFCSV